MKIFGPPNIEKLRKNKNVKKLIKALDYEQIPDIRAGAAKALGELNDSMALTSLIAASKDNDAGVRRAVIVALGQFTFHSAIMDVIIRSLDDEDSSVKDAAIQMLIKALDSYNIEIRERAAVELGKIKRKDVIAGLGKALNDYNAEVRLAALMSLTQVGDKSDVIAGLEKALNDSNAEVRLAALMSLTQVGDKSVVSAIAYKLADKDLTVQEAAFQTLERFTWEPDSVQSGVIYWLYKGEPAKCAEYGPKAVGFLEEQLASENKAIRLGAIQALNEIQGKDCQEIMKIQLTKEKEIDNLLYITGLLKKYGWKPEKANLFSAGTPESLYYLMVNWNRISEIVDELTEIGTTEGFLGQGPKFDSKRKHKRTRTLGRQLCRMGGTGLMQEVFKIIASKGFLGPSGTPGQLDSAWDGIEDEKYTWRA